MKKAFTMLELVMVIVVIGILAAVIIPRTDSNSLREAATQVISHIRYTQHLAMVDDEFDSTDANWYKKRWQIIVDSSVSTDGTPAYTIFSDTSGNGTPDVGEMAVNPLDSSKVLSGGYDGVYNTSNAIATREMNLGKYGINAYSLTGGCSGARISFDHMGRPLQGDLSSMTASYNTIASQRLLTQTCNIVLTGDDGNITISIEPETGYAHI
ncbi:MAG: type II secretion system GspH family protein [Sulfurimonas sp.]|nr:type II secretion system GspH family protein [Sulfurimonas sp.]